MSNLNKTTLFSLTFTLIATLAALSLKAQSPRGTILGTIRDATGAVLPGVAVTVTNLRTNVSYTFVTDGTGNYEIGSLLPGEYRVAAELTGFKKATVSGIVLEVDQKARVDITLEVGEIAETVEVTAAPILIQTDSVTLGQVINNRHIVDLPLVTRNYTQLMLLGPGVVQPVGGIQAALRTDQAGGAFSIAGARVSSNSFLIDGVYNNDQTFQTPGVTPSIDVIQEFKVQNGLYSAEYGQGVGQINIALKSGTNDLHGTFFEFIRNDALQPHLPRGTFRNPLTGGALRSPLRFNQFGGTFGGPVKLPGIYDGKDRTFFLLNYEGRRQRVGSFGFGILPTERMRRGDFSETGRTIYDPLTTRPDPNDPNRFIRDPFPNNLIPSARMNEITRRLLGFYPLPNLAVPIGPNNFGALITNPDNIDQFTVRLDHNTAKNSIFGRFTFANQFLLRKSFIPLSGFGDQQRGRNLGFQFNRTFSPRSLNEFRFGYNRTFFFRGFQTTPTNIQQELGFKNTCEKPTCFTLPAIDLAGRYSGMGFGGSITLSVTNTYHFVDNFTINRGKHSLKFGIDVRHNRFRNDEDFRTNGFIQFFGNYTNLPGPPPAANTGDPFADFLLGLPQFVQINQFGGISQPSNSDWSFFAQDDWKIAPNLTLNIGLRYEYHQPFREKDLGGSYFDPAFPGGRFVVADKRWAEVVNNPRFGCCAPPRVIDPDRNNLAPRFGLAWRPFGDNRTVVRAGYGVFYEGVSRFYYWRSYEKRLVRIPPPPITGLPLTPPARMEELFPAPIERGALPDAPIGASGLEKHQRDPYTQQWTLNVERELAPNMMFEIGYLGAKGLKLPFFFMFNQALSPSSDPRDPPQNRVPFKNFVPTAFVLSNQLRSSYHGMLLKVERRFSHGLQFLASYTVSKNIDQGSEIFAFAGTFNIIQNAHNLRGERGLASTDFPQRFVLSYIYELPFGPGRRWLNSSNWPTKHLLGGWQVNGITTFQSGAPFSIVAGAGDISNTGGLSAYARADRVGEAVPSGFRDAQRLRFEQGETWLWFDPAAFAVPRFGTFGNSGRNILRTPGMRNFDISFIKNNRISEQVNLQFRAEFFNIFSERLHTGNRFPGNNANVRATLGLMPTRDQLFNPRIIQFALKLLF